MSVHRGMLTGLAYRRSYASVISFRHIAAMFSVCGFLYNVSSMAERKCSRDLKVFGESLYIPIARLDASDFSFHYLQAQRPTCIGACHLPYLFLENIIHEQLAFVVYPILEYQVIYVCNARSVCDFFCECPKVCDGEVCFFINMDSPYRYGLV